jgi:hypothetical protein
MHIEIRKILAPRLAKRFQVFTQLASAEFEKRTKYVAGGGMNPSKTAQARTANEMSENRLSLVIRSMGRRYAGYTAGRNGTLKKRIAQAAGRVLEVPMVFLSRCRNVPAFEDELEFVRLSETSHEFSISVSIRSSKGVMEVQDVKCDSEFIPQSEKQSKEGNGIGPAGDSYSEAAARADRAGRAQMRAQATFERQ